MIKTPPSLFWERFVKPNAGKKDLVHSGINGKKYKGVLVDWHYLPDGRIKGFSDFQKNRSRPFIFVHYVIDGSLLITRNSFFKLQDRVL